MSYTATWLWEPETLYSEGRSRKYPCGSTLLLSRAVQRHDNCENFHRRCGRAPYFQPILLSVWSSWGHWSGHNHWHCHGKRPRFYFQSHQVLMSMLKIKKNRVEGIMGPWNSTWLQEFLCKFYINCAQNLRDIFDKMLWAKHIPISWFSCPCLFHYVNVMSLIHLNIGYSDHLYRCYV